MAAVQLEIDIETDDVRPVAELMKQLTGRRPSPPTVWRWCERGTKRQGVLPSVSIFGSRHTTREALQEWLSRGSGPTPPSPEPAERSEATSRRLKAAGLL